MATLASDLLDFILDLLRDPTAAEEFQAAPARTLADAGLGDVCLADLDDVQSLLSFVPEVAGGSAGLTSLQAAPSVASASLPASVAPAAAVPLTQVSPAAASESEVVIERLRDIQQTYTYNATTTVEVRDNIWAGQDVYEIFGDEAVLATGGSVSAGGDVDDVEVDNSIEDSFNIDDSFNPENSGNTQIGTGNVNGDDADVDLDNSGNTVRGDGNAVGRGNDVDNTDNSVEVEDSTGVNVGRGNSIGDVADGDGNALGNTVTVRDSGNETTYDESFNRTETDLDVDIDGSFNEETTEVDVTTEDILIGEDNIGGDATTEVELEDVGNTTDTTTITDNLNGSAVDFGRGDAVSTDDGDVTV
jgi:hypothetical protein